jgi:acetyl esterase/lipase
MDESPQNAKNAEEKHSLLITQPDGQWKLLCALRALSPPFASLVPLLAILLFLGALLWAKGQDPFSRRWFTLKITDHHSVKYVAVLPKPMRQYPVVIYAHGTGGTLMNDGDDLRQMAELGLATVSLEYNQTNEAAFDVQFETLLNYLNQQKWANTNAIAWVGFSLGANRMLDFALQHPEQQPQVLVQLSGRVLDSSTLNTQLSSNLHCPVLLVHGEQDDVFPLADTKRLASVLPKSGLPVELKIISGASHGMEPDRAVVFRCIGEYCLTHLVGKDTWQNFHSIVEWQAKTPPFWLFCLPAVAWAISWFAWWRYHKPVSALKRTLKIHEIALRWLTVLLGIWASVVTAIHLITPHFVVNDETLSIARRFLLQPKERADFECLAAQPIWRGQKLETLLTDVALANYNRELINWQVDEKHYRDYVLSPVITGHPDEKFNWHRPLWEEFYPRIRQENSPEDAARIVVRHLRARVTIADLPNLPQDVPAIWLKQITDKTGFEIIYVAALRSVGVPARLNSWQQAEIWDDHQWHTAPGPPVSSW